MTMHPDDDAAREEIEAADLLRRALEGDPEARRAAPLVRVAEQARAAAGLAPPLDPRARDAHVETAIRRATARRRQRWAVAFAAAAVAVLVLGLLVPLASRPRAVPPDDAFAAPTDALFDGPFPDRQSAAERMDTIVAARTRGYFAALAVRR